MSKAQHTPGPWVVWKNGQTIDGPRTDDGVRNIVAVAQGNSPEEQNANARLIAAAPDLLEALEAIIEQIYAEYPEGLPFYLRTLVAQADATIAKAQGK